MIIGGVAKRYAQALFELGLESGTYRGLLAELTDFCDFLAENVDVKKVLESSIYNVQEKRGVLNALLKGKNYSEMMEQFLRLIQEKRRISFIPQIRNGLLLLVESHEGIERVDVTVASALDKGQKKEIVNALEKSTGKKVVLEESVDPSIIGGLIIKAGSKIYDGSILTQVNALGEKLKKG